MTTDRDYRPGKHVVSALHAHLASVTTYLRDVLIGEHIRHLAAEFSNVCGDFGATLSECNGQDDHVHLLVDYPPKLPVSSLVNSRKGVAARKIRQRYQIRAHREHLWCPSYFAASCGGTPPSITKQYVGQQWRPGA